MMLNNRPFKTIYILYFTLFVFSIHSSNANIIGSPPISKFEIPTTDFSQHFDIVQDSDNYIIIADTEGVKVFDGARWKSIKLPVNRLLRKLYYDDHRVYIGGWDVIGYLEKDVYGQYQFTDLTPKPSGKSFKSIWQITECNETIYFRALNDVFSFDKSTNLVNQWDFDSKLGAIACVNNEVLLQDRAVGIKTFQNEKWVLADIQTDNNELIYDIEVVNEQTSFILSQYNQWQTLEENKVMSVIYEGALLEQENYVSIKAISNQTVVLGSNNGFISIVDIKNQTTQSFQLSNDWIVSIIRSNSGGFIVLTDYEIYYVSWPSPWREQGDDTGLSSDIYELVDLDGVIYSLSSSGVFKEEVTEYNNKRKSFKRLNWTNKEAWDLYQANDKSILLAESQKILHINNGKVLPITDVIYPRKFYPSEHYPNIVFLRTELDVKIMYFNSHNKWEFIDVINEIPISIIELNEKEILVSTYDKGIFKIELKSSQTQVSSLSNVTKQIAANLLNVNELNIKKLGDEIFAINDSGIYKLVNNKFEQASLNNVEELVSLKNLSEIYKSKDNRYWLVFQNKIVYQDVNMQWQILDLSANLRGYVGSLLFQKESIKIAAGNKILTFIESLTNLDRTPSGKFLITDINLHKGYLIQKQLPIMPKGPIQLEMEDGELVINFVYNDLQNIDNILYSYRLKGGNERWSKFSQATEVSFNNLKAGSYQLELQAKGPLGKIYRIEPYNFIVTPKWYLGKFAQVSWLIMGLLLFWLILYYFIKWREKVHEQQKAQLKTIIDERTIELKLANNRLKEMAHTDGLTGLSNRIYIDKYIDQLIQNRVKNVFVMMLDMDHFKKYNDTRGHVEGDKLLVKLAQTLKKEIADKNLIARFGGEEFLVILPDTELKAVLNLSEKIRVLVENKSEGISVSIGVAQSQTTLKDVKTIYQLIDQADKNLYSAKSSGRNRVYINNKD